MVALIVPPKIAVPIAILLFAPAPEDIARGMIPAINAKEVITIDGKKYLIQELTATSKASDFSKLTAEQKAMLTRLKAMPDTEIDTSDDWGDLEALTIESDKHLVEDFAKVCQSQRLSMNEVINQLMQSYVKQFGTV